MTAEAMLNAREAFASAIGLDPNYSRARSGKALTYSLGLRFLGEADRENGVHNLMAEARKAVELDDADSKAHVTLALAYMYTTPSQSSFAVAEANDAVALNPDDPQANSVLGVALALSANQFDDGALWIEKAVTINPLDPINHIYLSQLALAHLCAERYEKAVEVAEEAIRRRPGFIESHIALASACGYRGRYDDARTAIGEFEDVAQGFVRQHLVFSQDVKAHIILGLDRATLGN